MSSSRKRPYAFYAVRSGPDGAGGVYSSWEDCELVFQRNGVSDVEGFNDVQSANFFASERTQHDDRKRARMAEESRPPTNELLFEVYCTTSLDFLSGNASSLGFVVVRAGSSEALACGECGLSVPDSLMALLSPIAALKELKSEQGRILVFTDDVRLFWGVTTWIDQWRANGWHDMDGSVVAHQQTWEELEQMCSTHGPRLEWRYLQTIHCTPAMEQARRVAKEARLTGNYIRRTVSLP
mmetsp:Transcript_20993/g.34627  ORF Transcript_20993/g.34627 Transcript_20993/m.34627 type:complete len:239 (+) Transcript_20993:45-761(+)